MSRIVKLISELEKEADAIVSEAHSKAEAVQQRLGEEIEALRTLAAKELEERLVAYEQEARRRHEQALREEEGRLAEKLAWLESIPQGLIEEQVRLVLDRLRES